MTTTVRYGTDSSIKMELPPEIVLAEFHGPAAVPLEDPGSATAIALAEPIDFPPLPQALVPGDRVTLALSETVPQAPQIVAAIVHVLCDADILPEDITVLQRFSADLDPVSAFLSQLPRKISANIHWILHDPDDAQVLSFLGTTQSNQEIYLHRSLCDADVVLPVGSVRPRDNFGFHGTYAGIYPAFADRAALQRLLAPEEVDSPGCHQQRHHEMDEVGWHLGVSMAVQVLPAGSGQVLDVGFGNVREVFRQGEAKYTAVWSCTVTQRASLVVATLEGPSCEQSWANVARALANASRVVENGGSIAICSHLDSKPTEGLKEFSGLVPQKTLDQDNKETWPLDIRAAEKLGSAKDYRCVYLLSHLPEEMVELLGMAPVSSAADIGRLIRRHRSCILLGNAPHVIATVV